MKFDAIAREGAKAPSAPTQNFKGQQQNRTNRINKIKGGAPRGPATMRPPFKFYLRSWLSCYVVWVCKFLKIVDGFKGVVCRYMLMAKRSAFQAEDKGSSPFTCT